MKIRGATEKDLSSLISIAQESFPVPWSPKSFLEEFENSNSLVKVAEINGELVGFLILRIIQDEAEVLYLAVKPSHRGKGIATELLRSALRGIKGSVKSCFLEVRVSNTTAINLYKKLNFKVIGVRKSYYLKPEEDALLMRLDFQEERKL